MIARLRARHLRWTIVLAAATLVVLYLALTRRAPRPTSELPVAPASPSSP